MKYSLMFGKTIKDYPSKAMLVSHKMLIKGGFIREVAAGRFELLPLGARVYQKIIAIIEKHMELIGSQRVFTPTLHPKEIWQKTGRDKVWGKDLLSVKDERTGQEFAMAATGEGLFTEMVKDFAPSYRDLPIYLHQFSQKFRNEKRPRGGLVRLREFLMKDAYSFDADEDSFKKTYELFYNAYAAIAKELDLDAIPVEADNGALGGNYSHEFMVFADFGEDKVVKCDSCSYVANIERGEFLRDEVNGDEEIKEYKEVPLPYNVATMKELAAHYKMPVNRFIKNVVYKTDEGKILIVTVTGNLEVNETKLRKALKINGDIDAATDDDLTSFGAKSGFVHSWGYKDPRIIYVADESLTHARNLYGGYKTDTTDPINVNYGRDFKADVVADVASSPNGATCTRCKKGKLSIKKAIEFGHVFSYGDFYSKSHGATYRDKNGENKYILMGAYGIGVERAIATLIETHHDDRGIVWPQNVAPYKVHLILLDKDGGEVVKTADKLYKTLCDKGVEVLYDERTGVSAGVKFADADLIGVPYRVVVSAKTIQENKAELKMRNSDKTELVSEEELFKKLSN